MMLCLAIGDSLGNTTESKLPSARQSHFGEITGFLPHRRLGDARGYPSDDTQMAYWTLEHLIEHGRIIPEQLARTFATRRIFGIGGSVRDFVRNYNSGLDWTECGTPSAGNGALMRIAPLVYHGLLGHSHRVVPDSILATAITHNDSMALASSVAAVQILLKCCLMERPPEPEWWANEFITVLKEYEIAFNYKSRSPHYSEFKGSLWQFLEQELLKPHRMSAPLLEALDWYSGAYLLETVPTSLLILMRYANDPEQAMLRAVNDTKDNDTVAAIVGAFLGALHGKAFVPEPWLSGLAGRTGEDDDGAVFRILDNAKLRCLDMANGEAGVVTREIVAEGMFVGRWDRISGTVQSVDCAGSRLVISLRRRRASVVVEVDERAGVCLDGRSAGTGTIQPGHQLAAIGTYEGQAFRARSVRLYSSRSSPGNARNDPMQPPAIYFYFLNTGEVAIRPVGRPGEEVLLRDRAEFDALRENPEQLRLLLDSAHRGDLPLHGR